MPPPVNTAAPRLVVAESDAAVRQLTWVLLTRAGYFAHVAHDLPTAVGACTADPGVVAVVLDSTLSANAGDAITQLQRVRDTLGFVLIGDGQGASLEPRRVVRLDKPFSAADLLKAVAHVVGGR